MDLCFDDAVVFVDFTELEAVVICWTPVLGSKSSLSSVAVTGEQVEIEPTAARIESAVA